MFKVQWCWINRPIVKWYTQTQTKDGAFACECLRTAVTNEDLLRKGRTPDDRQRMDSEYRIVYIPE